MSDERMVDRDDEHVVGVGSVEGRGYTSKWPMSMNGVWPGFPPVSIRPEQDGSVGNRPQSRTNHFEHRLVANEDICLVLSHASAHSAGEDGPECCHRVRLDGDRHEVFYDPQRTTVLRFPSRLLEGDYSTGNGR